MPAPERDSVPTTAGVVPDAAVAADDNDDATDAAAGEPCEEEVVNIPGSTDHLRRRFLVRVLP
jgi:hypothetical protein